MQRKLGRKQAHRAMH